MFRLPRAFDALDIQPEHVRMPWLLAAFPTTSGRSKYQASEPEFHGILPYGRELRNNSRDVRLPDAPKSQQELSGVPLLSDQSTSYAVHGVMTDLAETDSKQGDDSAESGIEHEKVCLELVNAKQFRAPGASCLVQCKSSKQVYVPSTKDVHRWLRDQLQRGSFDNLPPQTWFYLSACLASFAGRLRITPSAATDGPDSSATHAPSSYQQSAAPKQNPPRKRRRVEPSRNKANAPNGGEEDEDEDDEERRPKETGGVRPRAGEPSSKRLACPYYRREPSLHLDCSRKKLYKSGHVRQHLKRAHDKPYCPICYDTFDNVEASEAHTRSRQCTPRPEPAGFVNNAKRQLALRHQLARGSSVADWWCSLWAVIFPDDEVPDSSRAWISDDEFLVYDRITTAITGPGAAAAALLASRSRDELSAAFASLMMQRLWDGGWFVSQEFASELARELVDLKLSSSSEEMEGLQEQPAAVEESAEEGGLSPLPQLLELFDVPPEAQSVQPTTTTTMTTTRMAGETGFVPANNDEGGDDNNDENNSPPPWDGYIDWSSEPPPFHGHDDDAGMAQMRTVAPRNIFGSDLPMALVTDSRQPPLPSGGRPGTPRRGGPSAPPTKGAAHTGTRKLRGSPAPPGFGRE